MAELQVMVLPERFDFSYHKTFSEQYQAMLNDKNTKRVVLDFNRVSYLDSSALGMMVLLQKKAKAQGVRVGIRGAKDTADDIIKMANLQQLYEIE